MEQIKGCPYCGSIEAFARNMTDDWHVVCKYCGSTGPDADHVTDAILLWNAAANALEAKDAELEALRQVVRDTDAARHKAYMNWQTELQRVEASDKRQDKLEAEIDRLKKYVNELADMTLQARDERDEAIEYRDRFHRNWMDAVSKMVEARTLARKYYQLYQERPVIDEDEIDNEEFDYPIPMTRKRNKAQP